MNLFIPDRSRWLMLDREYAKRLNAAGDYTGPHWLEYDRTQAARDLAAVTLRAVHSGLAVDPSDMRWATEWVAADEGWDPRWAPGSMDLALSRVAS